MQNNLNYNISQNSKLEDDIEQLITNKSSANLITHEFYSYQSLVLWNAITKAKKYYLTQEEISLVPKIAPYLNHYDYFADLGPGSDENALAKSLPLIDALGVSIYSPVDISPMHAYQAGNAIKKVRKNIEISPVIGNWEDNALNQIPQNALVYYSGCSIGNVPIYNHENTFEALQNHLRFLKHKLCGVDLLVTLDVNQNGKILEECYNIPLMRWFNHSLWQSFEELYHIKGLESHNVEVYSKWDKESHRICHIAKAKVDMNLYLNGRHTKWYKNKELVQSHSIKPTIEQFEYLAKKSGWVVDNVFGDKNIRIFYLQR